MNLAQSEHEAIKKQFTDKNFRKLKDQQEMAKILFKGLNNKDSNAKALCDFVIELMDDYYFALLTFPEILLFEKNKKAFIGMHGVKTMRGLITKFFKQGTFYVEIESIHSYSKGAGAQIIERIKKFSDENDCLISLWAENMDLVNYYQSLGFQCAGAGGENGEFLMIYKTNRITGWK